MSNMKFRVWDNENNKYFEPTYEAYAGKLEHLLVTHTGRLALRTLEGIMDESMFPDRFVVEWYFGGEDSDNKEMYEGDIVRIDDCEWGYGGDYDKTHDGYLYIVISLQMFLKDSLEYCLNEISYGKIVGNVHQNIDLLKGGAK